MKTEWPQIIESLLEPNIAFFLSIFNAYPKQITDQNKQKKADYVLNSFKNSNKKNSKPYPLNLSLPSTTMNLTIHQFNCF